MSRTIRRKNLVDNWYNDQPHYFHGDMLDGTDAPKKFRQMINRQFRSQNKHILRLMRSQDNYDLPFIVCKKTVDWEYL